MRSYAKVCKMPLLPVRVVKKPAWLFNGVVRVQRYGRRTADAGACANHISYVRMQYIYWINSIEIREYYCSTIKYTVLKKKKHKKGYET